MKIMCAQLEKKTKTNKKKRRGKQILSHFNLNTSQPGRTTAIEK